MKVLSINSNPKRENDSYSRLVARNLITHLEKDNDIIEVDLYSDFIPLIDRDVLDAWSKLGNGTQFEELTKAEKMKINRMNEILNTFMEADMYVFSYPLWNLSIPPMLKAYIDNITIARKTFEYTANGPRGLLNNKKAILIQASGGIYSSEKGQKSDFASTYMRNALSFIGVDDTKVVYVEGTALKRSSKEDIISESMHQIEEYLKKGGV